MLDNKEELMTELVQVGLNRVISNPHYPFGYSYNHEEGAAFSMQVLSSDNFSQFYDGVVHKDGLERLAAFFLAFDIDRISEYWKSRFSEFASLSYIRANYYDFFRGSAKRIELGALLAGMADSFDIMSTLFDVLIADKHGPPGGYVDIMKKAAREKPLAMKLFIEGKFLNNKTASYHADARAVLYDAYITSGFLTEKVARKIRSDASYYASMSGARSLVQNKDLYEDNYEELLLKFSDSRHGPVLQYLATNMPLYMLSSLLGCDNEKAKAIIERRMRDGK